MIPVKFQSSHNVIKQNEKSELAMLTQWIKLQYPNMIYRVDVGADQKLTIGQAKKNKSLQMSKRGYPDIFIAEPRFDGTMSHGLFIELKASGTVIYKKDGNLRKNPHLEEQALMHKRLRTKNYSAEFVIGFADCKKLIEWWMK